MHGLRIDALAVACLLSVAACGDNIREGAILEAEVSGLQITIQENPARLEIRDGDTILFDGAEGASVDEEEQFPAVALAARNATEEIEFLFGSFKIEEEFDPEAWAGVRRFSSIEESSDGIRFQLVAAGGKVIGSALISEGEIEGELSLLFKSDQAHNRMSLAFGCDEAEHFLGLGGQSFDVDHRGQTVPIWVQEDGIQKSEDDNFNFGTWFLNGRRHSTHTPMPMYLSSRGYGMIMNTSRRSIFAMCSEQAEHVRLEAWDEEMELHLFRAPTPLGIIEKMTQWTGRPVLPPAFAFAPWMDAIFGEENVRRVALAIREAGIPSSVIWSEDWRGGNDEAFGYTLEEDWFIDREIYPNVEALADELHSLGFKFFNYHNTFVDETADVFDEVVREGYGIHDAAGDTYLFDGVKFNKSTLLDLSNPAAVEWGKGVYRESLELGFDGYMADFAEWLPHDAVLASGEAPMAAHNLYPVEFQRMNKELFDEMFEEDGVERLFFVRSAYLGSQPLVTVVWAGDQQTDFSIGDGFPSIIPMGIGLGVTGFPYYGHDIAGYMSQATVPTSKELFYRWTTLGALSPVMRTHHGRSARENWNWESDAATTEHFRRWASLHMQLFPYLYALAKDASETGAPMFRPLALDYPGFEEGWTSVDQFMLGDRIIVAPIVEEGATSREVSLPEGEFYPLLGGAVVSGRFSAEAEIEDIPAFVPAGALLVLLPEGVSTAVDASADGVTTIEDAGDDRELWIYPGGSSSWEEVGGLSYSWQGDASSGSPDSATFNGEDVPLTEAAGLVQLELIGPGSLRFDDGSTLDIEGGASNRKTRLRLYTGR